LSHPDTSLNFPATFFLCDDTTNFTSVLPFFIQPITSITGKHAPRIPVTIESLSIPLLLDTGAELSVLPRSLLPDLLPNSNVAPDICSVYPFGGSPIQLEGPRTLRIQLCGVTLVHPFFFVDAPSPAIGGFDLITAARLVIDSSRRLTWSSYVTDPFQFPHLLLQSTTTDVDTPRSSVHTAASERLDADSLSALEPPAQPAALLQPLPSTFTAHSDALDTDITALKVPPPSSLSTCPQVDTITSSEIETELPVYLHDLHDDIINQPDFPPHLRSDLHCFLIKHANTFAKSPDDLGFCDILQHDIDTGDTYPIKQPSRRPPLSQGNVENELLDNMLASGVIEPSHSPWASPVTLVKKPDGSYRFCVDYRRLNAVSKSDAFPLPSIQDALDHLQGAKWFATIDLLSGYWQLGMTERAKEASAFCTRRGLFISLVCLLV